METNGTRTINDLRLSLWDCIEGLKSKRIKAADVNAITGAASQIIKSVKLELEYAQFTKRHPALGTIIDENDLTEEGELLLNP